MSTEDSRKLFADYNFVAEHFDWTGGKGKSPEQHETTMPIKVQPMRELISASETLCRKEAEEPMRIELEKLVELDSR